MDVNQIIADLRGERDQLNEAILALERVAYNQTRRRGRPPAWLMSVRSAEGSSDGDGAPKRRGRPPGSKNRPQA